MLTLKQIDKLRAYIQKTMHKAQSLANGYEDIVHDCEASMDLLDEYAAQAVAPEVFGTVLEDVEVHDTLPPGPPDRLDLIKGQVTCRIPPVLDPAAAFTEASLAEEIVHDPIDSADEIALEKSMNLAIDHYQAQMAEAANIVANASPAQLMLALLQTAPEGLTMFGIQKAGWAKVDAKRALNELGDRIETFGVKRGFTYRLRGAVAAQ